MSKQYAIGIDVGGTKIAAGLVDRAGQILCRYTTRAHAQQQPSFVIETIVQTYHAILHQSGVDPTQISALGSGFPRQHERPDRIDSGQLEFAGLGSLSAARYRGGSSGLAGHARERRQSVRLG